MHNCRMSAYIVKGNSEMHWNEINHFAQRRNEYQFSNFKFLVKAYITKKTISTLKQDKY